MKLSPGPWLMNCMRAKSMIELLEIVGLDWSAGWALLCDNNARAATQNQIWVIEPARNDMHALLCVLNMLTGHMSVVLV